MPSASPAPPPGYALVTGASSGIGERIAREYARRGVPLVLTARRADRLHALAEELDRRGVRIRILVNNAGYGMPGRYRSSDWADHAAFMQVMTTAVCELTWRLLPAIRADGRGRILNVASFAALMPAADGQTLYAPAKSFLLKFSEALALENADRGVHVTALCPGFTYSEFHDVTGTRARMRVSPGMWLQAEDVARAGIDGNERGQVLVVPGWRYRVLHAIVKLLPHRVAMGLMARNSRKVRPLD